MDTSSAPLFTSIKTFLGQQRKRQLILRELLMAVISQSRLLGNLCFQIYLILELYYNQL